MNYDEAVKVWAGQRLSIDPKTIFTVTWGGQGEVEKTHDPTYGDTDGYDVIVQAGCSVHYAILSGYLTHRQTDFIDLSDRSFADVLAEILGPV